ncbi:MAG: hypothetical protein HYY06_25525 [Deltaproteobacteria bacterium]|nr:hypothetical protein [Deltaproteobacteria bacterium]
MSATIRLALLGAVAAGLQTLVSRELLAAFSGNEAVLASLYGPWLLFTALGSALGRSGPRRSAHVAAAMGLLGPLGAVTLFAARALPCTFPAGAAPGPATALLASAVLLAPACLLQGLLFAWLARGVEPRGRAYVAESLGAAVAGAALSLVVLGRAPPFAVAGAMVLMSTAGALQGAPRRLVASAGALGLAVSVVLAALPWGRWALEAQGGHLAGALLRESPSASIAIVRRAGEVTVYADRLPVVSGADPAAAEEAAHLALALHPAPRSVAILGAPPPGTVRETLRHGVRTVDVLIEDPVLVEILRGAVRDLGDPRARLRSGDARAFLAARRAAFDAILLFSGEPTSAQLNRAFTVELFATARRALGPRGILSVSLPGHAEAASQGERRLSSSVRTTLASAFGSPVRVLPAGRTLYLASLGALPPATSAAQAVSRSLESRGIRPVHLTRALLANLLSPRRVGEAERWSSLDEEVNRDLDPTTYRIALDRVLSEFSDVGTTGLLVLAIALSVGALVVFGPRSRPVELAVLTSGGAGLAMELVLMLAYQIATGALYREIGLLLSGFMAGAAIGAAAVVRALSVTRLVVLCDLGQAALAAGLAAALPALVASGPAARPLVFAATLLAGLVPGAQFAAAARTRREGPLWAADLAGASIAALVTFTFAVPALGLQGALLLVAGVKAASSFALLLPPKPRPAGPRLALAAPLSFGALVVLSVGDRTQVPVYAFTFWPPTQIVAALAIFVALLSAFQPHGLRALLDRLARQTARFRSAARVGGERLAHFLVLVLPAALPIGRCYFSIPFLFCHVCPRQCVFGVLRPYAIPVALLANVHDRRFCERVCPLGTVQNACDGARGKRARRIGALRILRLLTLAFVVVAYFEARSGHRGAAGSVEGTGLYAAFFQNAFAPPLVALAVAAALLVGSFFVRRPFCDGLCPVGEVSTIVFGVEKLLRRPPEKVSP